MKKLIAIILCLAIAGTACVCSFSASAAQKEKTKEELIEDGAKKGKFLSWLVGDVLIGTIGKMLPNLSFVHEDSDTFDDEGFYAGNTFISTNTDNYTWKLGYDKQSIIPDDFGTPLKYARGSYCPWGYSTDYYTDDEGNKETMNVRTVLLDDGTGRGLVAICAVDCIGISNVDVRKIREGVADFAAEKNIVAIEISAIHSHMAIDTQGVWGSPLTTAFHNFLSLTGLVKPKSGVNQDYLNTIIDRTATSIKNAYSNMKEGKLSYTNIELEDYFHTRTVSHECDEDMHKLMFVPDDGSKGTMICSFGVHPELTSYGAEFNANLSSDFVYYMDKLSALDGKNFMYIQGNVGTNGPGTGKSSDGLDLANNHEKAIRYGYELAYIALGASMSTEERIALNDKLGDKLGVNTYGGNEGYTPWYEDLPTFEEIPLEAVMNVRNKQVKLEMDNTTAIVLIKLGLASNYISYNKSEKKYYTVTEIGYLQLGSAFKAFMSPGELYSELYVGGYGLEESSIKSLRETYGDDVILFDLVNDAAGYVCPDETYGIMTYRWDEQSQSIYDDAWCMTVSIGSKTASTLINGYADLMSEAMADIPVMR